MTSYLSQLPTPSRSDSFGKGVNCLLPTALAPHDMQGLIPGCFRFPEDFIVPGFVLVPVEDGEPSGGFAEFVHVFAQLRQAVGDGFGTVVYFYFNRVFVVPIADAKVHALCSACIFPHPPTGGAGF